MKNGMVSASPMLVISSRTGEGSAALAGAASRVNRQRPDHVGQYYRRKHRAARRDFHGEAGGLGGKES